MTPLARWRAARPLTRSAAGLGARLSVPAAIVILAALASPPPEASALIALYAAAYSGMALAVFGRERQVALLRETVGLKDQTIGFLRLQLAAYRRVFPGPFDGPDPGGIVTVYIAPPGGDAPPAPPRSAPSPN